MNNFFKDLEKDIISNAKEQLSKEDYEIDCPNCNNSITVTNGMNKCSFCNEEINFNLKFDF